MSEANVMDRPATDLVVAATLNAQIVFAPGGVDKILDDITAKVRSIKTDISTAPGRAAVASLAHKVARSKTALDDLGKNLVADLKKKTGAVDAERRTIRERLDALKDEVRKPLTDWENADKLRIEQHETGIGAINMLTQFSADPTASEVRQRLQTLEAMPPRDWQEFTQRATEAATLVRAALAQRLADAETREAERAELERLRKENEARAQKERDERIAAQAAETARIAAETKAAAAAKAAADAAEASRQRVEKEKADAIARAEQAEAARQAAEAKAERDRIAAEEKAERDRIAAIDAERKRVAAAKAAEDAATAKREADKKHKARIDNEAMGALRQWLGPDAAKEVIIAIASGKIPHVSISY